MDYLRFGLLLVCFTGILAATGKEKGRSVLSKVFCKASLSLMACTCRSTGYMIVCIDMLELRLRTFKTLGLDLYIIK